MYAFAVDRDSGQYQGAVQPDRQRGARVHAEGHGRHHAEQRHAVLAARMDLRAEPLVLCVPEVEKGRYYSVQLIDLYTFNFGYIGSRATGNGAGCYMVAGPGWKGERPRASPRCSGADAVLADHYRTQLFNPADIEREEDPGRLQGSDAVQLLGIYPRRPPRRHRWPKFDQGRVQGRTSPTSTSCCSSARRAGGDGPRQLAEDRHRRRASPSTPRSSRRRTSGVGIGIKDGYEKIKKRRELRQGRQRLARRAAFGDRAFFKGDWLLRAAAAIAGIYGNDAVEAMYPMAATTARGQARRQQAPLHAHLPGRAVAAGERLLVGDHVRRQDAATDREPDQPLPDQLADAAGHEEERRRLADHLHSEGFAGQGKESNWLPAPDGPIYLVMRLYWPKDRSRRRFYPLGKGTWKPPGIVVASK